MITAELACARLPESKPGDKLDAQATGEAGEAEFHPRQPFKNTSRSFGAVITFPINKRYNAAQGKGSQSAAPKKTSLYFAAGRKCIYLPFK